MLTALIPSLSIEGLENIQLGGQDMTKMDAAANILFMRVISVTLEYDTSVPNIWTNQIFKDLFATGTAIIE